MSTITFTCYSCNQMLRVGADKAGKKAKCVKCGTILTIPVAATEEADAVTPAAGAPPAAPRRPTPPPPARDDFDDEPAPRRSRRDDDYEEAPRRRRPRHDDDDEEAPRRRPRDDYDDDYDRPRRKWGDWSKVKVGLLLNTIVAGMVIGYGGLMLLASLFGLLGFVVESIGLLRTSSVLSGIGQIENFLLQILAVVAYVFCLFAANKHGTLALAITSLALGGVALILKIFTDLLPAFDQFSGRGFGGSAALGRLFRPDSVAAIILIGILVRLVLAAEYVIFPLYLGAVGKTVKDRWLASSAMGPMTLACVVTGLHILSLILTVALLRSGPPSRGTFIVIMLVHIITYGMVATFGTMYLRANRLGQSAVA